MKLNTEHGVATLPEMTLSEIGFFVTSESGDEQIAEFMVDLQGKAASRPKFKALCVAAADDLDEETHALPASFFKELYARFGRFIEAAPTGHGNSHLLQDLLTAMIMSNDDELTSLDVYAADFWSGIVAGIIHDIGNSVVLRYADYNRRNGHAEIGAWLAFELLDGLVSEEMRYLIAYAMAAHTHYTKPVEIKRGGKVIFTRPVYWYEDIPAVENPEDVVTVNVLVCRAIDRLGTRGATLWGREPLSKADFSLSGEAGTDLSGQEQKQPVNAKALWGILQPQLGQAKGQDDKMVNTVFQHMLNLQGGDLGRKYSVYGRNDGRLGAYSVLMAVKHAQTQRIIKAMQEEPDLTSFDAYQAMATIKNAFAMISRSLTFNRAWKVMYGLFEEMDDGSLAKWENVANVVVDEHTAWLRFAIEKATENDSNPMLPLLEEVIADIF